MLDPKSRNERIQVGATIAVVYYVEQQPHYAYCKIVSSRPFEIECSEDQADHLSPEQRLMLVFEGENGITRAITTVTGVRHIDGGYRVSAESPKWEQLEKRSYPRFDMNIPAKIRTAIEANDGAELREIEGITENVGLGGAWIRAEGAVPQGNLVEIRMELDNGTTVRILGVAVRTADRPGFAVQFLDYVGTARHHLHNFLNAAA